MNNHDARQERRCHLRICPKGTVVAHAGSQILRGRVANLSRGGLSMITRTTAPERLLGSTVEIELRLDGTDASWLRLQGRVVRIAATLLAVKFDEVVSASFTRILDDTVHASHHNERLLSVLLVDAVPERRQAMVTAFRAAGCLVLEVSTPLEAIVRLGESRFEPDLIAIADSLPVAIADELRRFVDAEHPRAKLVTIGDAIDGPAGLSHWLSSANPSDDLATRVRRVLTTFERR